MTADAREIVKRGKKWGDGRGEEVCQRERLRWAPLKHRRKEKS